MTRKEILKEIKANTPRKHKKLMAKVVTCCATQDQWNLLADTTGSKYNKTQGWIPSTLLKSLLKIAKKM